MFAQTSIDTSHFRIFLRDTGMKLSAYSPTNPARHSISRRTQYTQLGSFPTKFTLLPSSLIRLMYALRWILYFVISRLITHSIEQCARVGGEEAKESIKKWIDIHDSKSQFSTAVSESIVEGFSGPLECSKLASYTLLYASRKKRKIKSMRHHNSIFFLHLFSLEHKPP